MVNNRIIGRVVDINNEPLINYKVKAWDVDPSPLLPDNKLGEILTDETGEFEIRYSALKYQPPFGEKEPDIKLEICMENEPIFVTPVRSNVKEEVLDFGTIEVIGQNVGVKGRIIDEHGKSMSRLVVVAEDIDPVGGNEY